MAQNRSGGKRRLAALITISILIVSCGQEAESQHGWFAPDAVETLSVAPHRRSILLRVELPRGYVAAEDFVQRATLVVCTEARTVVEFELYEPLEISIDPATWQNEEIGLELMLGYCEYDVREVCYIDTPRLNINLQAEDEARSSSSSQVTIMYRPEPPQ
ncbi:MAG: hypothetical protein ACOC2N_06235 [Spirochaetota bacterium]